MTEKQWLACTDPKKMLEFLQSKATDRKLRLFVYHCFCRINPTKFSERLRQAIPIIERYADGLATEKKREAAYKKAYRDYNAWTIKGGPGRPARVACLALVDRHY